MESNQQSLFIQEEKYITPLNQVLNETIPKANTVESTFTNPTFKKSLDELFPEQKYEEKRIQKAKKILGSISGTLTLNDLKEIDTKIQLLSESWLDDFERKIFNGLTLRELLHNKGG